MSVTTIEDLRAKRKGQIDEQRAIVAAAEEANRDLTAEEASEFEARQAEFDSLSGRIERMEKLEGFADESQAKNPAKRESLPSDISADPAEQDAIEIRAFEKVLRSKGDLSGLDKEERASLNLTAANGGYTVPAAFEKQLIESMREFGIIGSLATHIKTADSGALSIPKGNAHASATWTAEEVAYTQSEPTFATLTLNAYKLGVISKISDELLHDSYFDILGFLAKDHGEALGLGTNAAYATGASGSTTTPEGLVTKASTGVTSAVNTGFTSGELIDLYHSLLAPYRQNAVFLMNDATVKIIRKFTEAVNGQYLWQPGLSAGTPDTLLGRPVYTDTNIATNAASARVAVFGDIAKAYIVRDVVGTSTKVLNELYAATGQIGFRTEIRTDGDVRDTAAVKALVIAA